MWQMTSTPAVQLPARSAARHLIGSVSHEQRLSMVKSALPWNRLHRRNDNGLDTEAASQKLLVISFRSLGDSFFV
jgi:hypothetical protein